MQQSNKKTEREKIIWNSTWNEHQVEKPEERNKVCKWPESGPDSPKTEEETGRDQREKEGRAADCRRPRKPHLAAWNSRDDEMLLQGNDFCFLKDHLGLQDKEGIRSWQE